jgi:hypothetical protein
VDRYVESGAGRRVPDEVENRDGESEQNGHRRCISTDGAAQIDRTSAIR